MINNNRNYKFSDYSKNQKYGPYRKQKTLLLLQRIFIALLFSACTLGLVLTVSIIGKSVTQKDRPLFELGKETTEAVAQTIDSVPTPTPAPTPTPRELLPENELADAYWGELVECENPVEYEHVPVHGLYLNAAVRLDENIELANNSLVDAFVIDLKEAEGVYFNSTNEFAHSLGYVYNAYNLEEVCERCHENNIRVIGRIVCFKDPTLAERYPDRAIADANGNPLFFTTEGSKAFANPYDSRNWDYLIDLALEAIDMGVDEIQFDYVRFPTGSTTSGADPYYGAEGTVPTKADAVNRFLQTARIRIQDTLGIPVSGDIFGIAVTSSLDGQILGQDWGTVGFTGVDSVCPMIYPSHYALGTVLNSVEYDCPDRYPYDIMLNALLLGSDYYLRPGYAEVRPYIQCFTAYYLGEGHYLEHSYETVDIQIYALQRAGLNEWILWNALCLYPEGNYDGETHEL